MSDGWCRLLYEEGRKNQRSRAGNSSGKSVLLCVLRPTSVTGLGLFSYAVHSLPRRDWLCRELCVGQGSGSFFAESGLPSVAISLRKMCLTLSSQAPLQYAQENHSSSSPREPECPVEVHKSDSCMVAAVLPSRGSGTCFRSTSKVLAKPTRRKMYPTLSCAQTRQRRPDILSFDLAADAGRRVGEEVFSNLPELLPARLRRSFLLSLSILSLRVGFSS